METWLYQMTERAEWDLEDFQRYARDGRIGPGWWDERNAMIYRFGGRLPEPGDLVFFFFARGEGGRTGLCGLGVITQFGARRRFRFRALPPSALLATDLRWGETVKALIDKIRQSVPQGTWWRVREVEHVLELHNQVLVGARNARARILARRRRTQDRVARKRR
jgi:hypothetical protein